MEKKEIANGFCAYFTSIGSSIHNYGNNLTNSISWKSFPLDFYNAINPIDLNFEFNQVDVAQVYTLLLSINSTKAAGCDHIPTKLIKDGASGLATPLSLINRSLNKSVFPAAEKLAKISPVYKSGDHSILDNYRPISVLNVLSKVIEREVRILTTVRIP